MTLLKYLRGGIYTVRYFQIFLQNQCLVFIRDRTRVRSSLRSRARVVPAGYMYYFRTSVRPYVQ